MKLQDEERTLNESHLLKVITGLMMITRFASLLCPASDHSAATTARGRTGLIRPSLPRLLSRLGLPASLAVITLFTASCATDTINFATMSEEELFAYNLDQPIMKRVLCREERSTSSFIRKRRCATVEDLVAQYTDSVMSLDVLNFGGNFNAGIYSGRD